MADLRMHVVNTQGIDISVQKGAVAVILQEARFEGGCDTWDINGEVQRLPPEESKALAEWVATNVAEVLGLIEPEPVVTEGVPLFHVYKIRNRETEEYSAGGSRGHFSKDGKVWSKLHHLRSSLRQAPSSTYHLCDMIKFECREVERTPVSEIASSGARR